MGVCTASTLVTQVTITAPLAIAGVKLAGTAAFGPQTFSVPATDVVVVNDGSTAGAGGSVTDGCDVPFVNAAAIVGKIAYMDRGVCGFGVKAKNAELAGAIGVLIGNNAAGVVNMAAAAGVVNLIPALSVCCNRMGQRSRRRAVSRRRWCAAPAATTPSAGSSAKTRRRWA